MKIYLKNTKFYFLSCNNEKRVAHMNKEFTGYDITEVNPLSTEFGISKEQSGSTGFSKMLDIALLNQDKIKPFQPFVLFEDDIKKYRDFPEELDIPENSDILYIGLSSWGMTNAPLGSNGSVCFSNISSYPEIVKVYNMLSTHGFIICSMVGLITLQKCLFEDFYRNRGYDMALAHIQPHINAYAIRRPLVYQYQPIGGQEVATKIEIRPDIERNIPTEWINFTNISYRTRF
jgi:hypothetical protein